MLHGADADVKSSVRVRFYDLPHVLHDGCQACPFDSHALALSSPGVLHGPCLPDGNAAPCNEHDPLRIRGIPGHGRREFVQFYICEIREGAFALLSIRLRKRLYDTSRRP